MRPADVFIDVSASTKTELLQILSNKTAHALGVRETNILAALLSRENLGSTGIGAGIANPHASIAGINSPYVLLIRLTEPVAFEAVDENQ